MTNPINMKIDKSDIKVSFSFSPTTHILVYATRCGVGPKEWSLNPRIDRSDKGKAIDDIGIAEIYIGEDEAEELKKAGFSYIEL